MSNSEYRPVTELTYTELQDEYRELADEMHPDYGKAGHSERCIELWGVLLDRTAIEQPACPNCDARDWRFDVDHFECAECGHWVYDEDLDATIQGAHNLIINKPEADL